MADDEYTEMLSQIKGFPTAIIHYPEEMMKYVVPALGIPNEVCAWCYNSNLPKQFRLINFYDVNVEIKSATNLGFIEKGKTNERNQNKICNCWI